MTHVTDALNLTGGHATLTIRGRNADIPADPELKKGSMAGNRSVFFVYDKPNYNKGDSPNTKEKTIESTSDTELGFVARSAQGFNKDGIVLFEHPLYNGSGHASTENIPSMDKYFKGDGLSSFIVYKERWAFYLAEGYSGARVSIDGQTEFVPGDTFPAFPGVNNKIKSMELLQD